jgi:tetratricopeptide (TPR) repeat protein
MNNALVVALLATALLAPSLALGAGVEKPESSPQTQAQEHYRSGLDHRDQAWELEKQAAAAKSDKDRAKLEAKAQKQWEKAISELELATQNDDRLYQAFGSLGYALRKTGDFEASLKAYDRALSLEPDYPEAIEYRGEAYLGLDRVDDAQDAYIRLFSIDRAQADTLLAAVKTWVEQRRADGGVDAATLDRVAAWVSQREEIAGQTAPVSRLRDRSW